MNIRYKSRKWIAARFDKSDMSQWNWICQHHGKMTLGKYTDIGAFTYINAKHKVAIGDFVQIGSHCSIYTVSTIDKKKGPVIIENYVRIGTHSTIMPGINIGEFSLIGAYSFVNKNIPAGVLAYGVPVKVIRKLTKAEKEDLLL